MSHPEGQGVIDDRDRKGTNALRAVAAQVSAMLRLRSGPDASIRPIPKETGLMIIFDNPATVPAPAGQYSHLARLDLGYKTMLQLSGQVAIDADGKIVGPDDMFAQADYIMDNITAILASQRATLADVANIRSYVTDMDRLPEFGRVRAARFPGTPPTITTVEVSRLWVPGALIEVEVFAII
jgi:2-iminobutanoate/2-iminopropanoate deaminase